MTGRADDGTSFGSFQSNSTAQECRDFAWRVAGTSGPDILRSLYTECPSSSETVTVSTARHAFLIASGKCLLHTGALSWANFVILGIMLGYAGGAYFEPAWALASLLFLEPSTMKNMVGAFY